MKKIISTISALVLLIIIAMTSCNKLSKGKVGSDLQLVGEPTIVLSGTNNLFLTCNLSNGDSIAFYGTRDLNGYPGKINRVVINQSSGKKFSYMYDDAYRLTDLVSDDGSRISLSWQSASTANISVESGDGQHQISTFWDKNAPSVGNSWSAKQTGNGSTRTGKPTINFIPFSDNNNQKTTVSGTATIMASRCGFLADADIELLVYNLNNEYIGYLPAKRLSKGTYSAVIPSSVTPWDQNTNIQKCQYYLDALSDWGDHIDEKELTSLGNTISNVKLGLKYIFKIGLEDNPWGLIALEAYSTLVDALHAPAVANNWLTSLSNSLNVCNTLKKGDIDISSLPGINVYPVAFSSPNAQGPTVTIQGQSQAVNISFDLGSNPLVDNFALTPSSAISQQSYTAVAEGYCLPPGSEIKIAIEGTDGYENSVTYTISNSSPNSGQFTLVVPGAPAGVQDYVYVSVSLPNQASPITKYAITTFK